MPRLSPQFRRQRKERFTSPLSNWRPRISSPLTSEVTFASLDEKWPLSHKTCEGIVDDFRIARRTSNTQIGLSLIVDALMSVWLCRIALDNFINLRLLLAAIPTPFNQPGTILFCNSKNHDFGRMEYPALAPEQSLSGLTELPSNCVFLPHLIVKIGQSQSLAGMIPLLVACGITLKLAFGYLLLRTSKRNNAPLAYFKFTTALHLLVSYATFVYIHVHIDLLLYHYPRLEKALRVSSECLFFLAGVTVCLFLLAIVVVPLLWICSSYAHTADVRLPTSAGTKVKNSLGDFNHHHQNAKHAHGFSSYKKSSI